MRRAVLVLSLVALAACAKEGAAPSAKALNCEAKDGGAVTASDAWVREQADKGGMTAAYFTICNGGMAEATLKGLTTPVAAMAELHETTRHAAGVVSMAPTGEITLKPGERLVFEPGGRHAMLMALTGAIAAGDRTNLVLQFTDGSSVAVEAVAKSAADAAGGS